MIRTKSHTLLGDASKDDNQHKRVSQKPLDQLVNVEMVVNHYIVVVCAAPENNTVHAVNGVCPVQNSKVLPHL